MQTDRRDVKPKTSFHKIEHPLGSKIFQPKVYSWESFVVFREPLKGISWQVRELLGASYFESMKRHAKRKVSLLILLGVDRDGCIT